MQDTIVVIPPYPYSITEEILLMFLLKTVGMPVPSSSSSATCVLLADGSLRTRPVPSYKIGPDDLMYNLVFFSTFEELDLPIHGPMEDAGILKLY